jgi:glutathione S-transferase
MMKLFYAKGACSLAPHIVMAELNMVYELEAVDLKTKICASGDFTKINSKGAVPALRMENGEILTEGPVINQYLCDLKNDSTLFPKIGTTERYRCLELLNYITSEVHKTFSPLFSIGSISKEKTTQDEVKAYFTESLTKKVNFLSEKLGSNDYLMGNTFTIADAYLFTCLNWGQYVNFDMKKWSNMTQYMDRVAKRPAVMKAMKEQGML